MAGLDGASARRTIVAERVASAARCSASASACRCSSTPASSTACETAGLGVLPGRVEPLQRADPAAHGLEHRDARRRARVLFAGLDAETRFYFVHSYAARRAHGRARRTIAAHGEPFVAAVESGAVGATQFHPEKSGDAGAACCELAGDRCESDAGA